ncbi:hypothetical protein LEP1GSC007_0330 [Leptospira interrogans serovar Bulgarica str. Mallika]|nr:hypothetical protein LEP1GSC007_0330 [Leptospira interrogans serovar Bulgarica str. Mallika]
MYKLNNKILYSNFIEKQFTNSLSKRNLVFEITILFKSKIVGD